LQKPGGGWGSTNGFIPKQAGISERDHLAIYYKIRGPIRITQSLIYVQHIILPRKPVNENDYIMPTLRCDTWKRKVFNDL